MSHVAVPLTWALGPANHFAIRRNEKRRRGASHTILLGRFVLNIKANGEMYLMLHRKLFQLLRVAFIKRHPQDDKTLLLKKGMK